MYAVRNIPYKGLILIMETMDTDLPDVRNIPYKGLIREYDSADPDKTVLSEIYPIRD